MMMPRPRIAAVIVTFNNAEMLRTLLTDLFSQSRPPDSVIVIDNSSNDATSKMIRCDFPTAIYKRMPENTGSAGGYHEGFRISIADCDFIWTLDDDVRLHDDSLEKLVAGFSKLSQTLRIGAVRSTGAQQGNTVPTPLEIAPWRGTLFCTLAVKKIGLPRSDYFLYGEDLEYSLRLHRNGYRIFWIPESVCKEIRVGKIDGRLLNIKVLIYPSAFRLYYAFRNEMSIFIEYKMYGRVIRLLLYAGKVILYILFSDRSNGIPKLLAVINGLRNGLRRKLGRNEAYLP
jgi:GT2 family glycosyltransferase